MASFDGTVSSPRHPYGRREALPTGYTGRYHWALSLGAINKDKRNLPTLLTLMPWMPRNRDSASVQSAWMTLTSGRLELPHLITDE
ncbi:hypothetical protein PENARI_c015G03939 [Penicillium arizonense]|uniref:Uncharacterized protein n=1 Tax=Penicillium arizonense TaxID=1835702 RepID=A0A1F5LCY8_PENAI|nr:hypothetical protein PENARI_c015G03939 [Penicillium arizonense]OGE51025.1 hypothetical protein PENARI_c015G03939 [Penicillium arizonense]